MPRPPLQVDNLVILKGAAVTQHRLRVVADDAERKIEAEDSHDVRTMRVGTACSRPGRDHPPRSFRPSQASRWAASLLKARSSIERSPMTFVATSAGCRSGNSIGLACASR